MKTVVREYGISTDSIDVLKRFNANGTCSVVQVNYSLLNRRAESEVLPYCAEHGIGVMIRGPLAQGLLSGRYTADSVFTDAVRAKWHTDEAQQAKFKANVASVEKLKQVLEPGEDMVTAALRFTTSPAANPVSIPGPKSPQQATMNAAAGDRTLSTEEIEELVALLD